MQNFSPFHAFFNFIVVTLFEALKDSPKSLFDKKSVAELMRPSDSIGNNLPVIGLPPRVTLGNYTDRVMLNLRDVLKV